VREVGTAQIELGRQIREAADFDGETALICHVTVYASFLDAKGPTYQVLGRAPLGG
jgi:hypothetical protein